MHTDGRASSRASAPTDWPADQLEAVPQCPVCRSGERRTLHTNLRDTVFFAAPGAWTMWRCLACGCGYLDPRPTPESIVLAYAAYYTHDDEPRGRRGLRWLHDAVERLKDGLDHGFLNVRYGYRLQPAIPGGAFLRGLMPGAARKLEHRTRHLPPPRSRSARLLDVGCGNGEFLRIATTLGYQAAGIEFDAKACAIARAAGFEVVHARIPGSGMPQEDFEHVTLNHVIEHLHDPVAALVEIRALLKPGGRIWIKTPNIDAPGHALYADAWRGLEPPRHLVLFGANALVQALRAAGFTEPKLLAPAPEAWFYLRSSAAIADGADPYGTYRPPAGLAGEARGIDRRALHRPEQGESITVTAYKERGESPRE